MIQLPACLRNPTIKVDGSVGFRLETRELSGEEYAEIAKLANKEIWIGMSEVQITKLDIPEEITEFKGEKTPSQRLRNSLYILWEKTGKTTNFEQYRDIQMNKIIEYIKEKIPN